MKTLRYMLEAAFVYVLYGIFRLMPVDAASATGGAIGRFTGPKLATSRKALANLREALPEKTEEEYKEIIKGMWENFGRVFAEYPHLAYISKNRVEFVNAAYLETLRDDGRPGIAFSGHLGNWEISGPSFLNQYNLPIDVIYRAPNNPWVDKLLKRARSLRYAINTIPKSSAGTRRMVEVLKKGGHIGILIDQKYNEGVSVPFMGRPAMTSTAFVQVCQKYACPLVPVQVERLKGAHFRITFFEPLPLFDESGMPLAHETVIEKAHKHFETWIRKRPEQWIWLHRRWSDKAAALYEDPKKD